jgi:hypothetical protein
MIFPIFLSLFFFFLSTGAYRIVIDKPSAHSALFSDSVGLVRWTCYESDPIFTHADIILAFGSHDSYTVVSTLANNLDIFHSHFMRFITPTRSFNEGNYFIVFKAVGADYESFSATFKILARKPVYETDS